MSLFQKLRVTACLIPTLLSAYSQLDSKSSREVAAPGSSERSTEGDPQDSLPGEKLFQSPGDCNKATAALERIARLQPGLPEAQLNLGIHRFQCGRPADALEPFKRAIQIAPENGTAYFYLGVCYLALDREAEATTVFKRIAALIPADVDQLYVLMKSYSGLSSALLERMTEVGPDSHRIHQVRGEYFEMQNNPDLALEEYKIAVQKAPSLATLHFVLGSAYWERFKPEDAAQQFRMAIQLDPAHYMAHHKVGLIHLEGGRNADAINEFRIALKLQPGLSDAFFGLGKALYRQGNWEAALPQLGRGLEINPSSEQGHYLLYQIFLKLNRKEEAKRELEKLEALRKKAKQEKRARAKRLLEERPTSSSSAEDSGP